MVALKQRTLVIGVILVAVIGSVVYLELRPSHPPPGWFILNMPDLFFSNQDVYLVPGETTIIPFELEVRNCAQVSTDNFLHIGRFAHENVYRELPLLEGLEFTCHPKEIELRPNEHYFLELEIRADPEVEPGDYCFGISASIPFSLKYYTFSSGVYWIWVHIQAKQE